MGGSVDTCHSSPNAFGSDAHPDLADVLVLEKGVDTMGPQRVQKSAKKLFDEGCLEVIQGKPRNDKIEVSWRSNLDHILLEDRYEVFFSVPNRIVFQPPS